MKKLFVAFIFVSAVFAVRPSNFYWGTGPSATNAEPSDSRKLNGWFPGERPAAQHFNYLFNLLGQWVNYLDTDSSLALCVGNVILDGLNVTNTGTNTAFISTGVASIKGKIVRLETNTTIRIATASGGNRICVVCINTNSEITNFYGEIETVLGPGPIPSVSDDFRPLANFLMLPTGISTRESSRMQGVLLFSQTNNVLKWFYRISDAVLNAPSFSQINILPGNYYEKIMLNGANNLDITFLKGARVFKEGTVNQIISSISNTSNIRIAGGYFDTSTSVFPSIFDSALIVVNVNGLTLDRVIFNDASTNMTVLAVGCKNFLIRDSLFIGSNSFNFISCTNITIVNSTIEDSSLFNTLTFSNCTTPSILHSDIPSKTNAIVYYLNSTPGFYNGPYVSCKDYHKEFTAERIKENGFVFGSSTNGIQQLIIAISNFCPKVGETYRVSGALTFLTSPGATNFFSLSAIKRNTVTNATLYGVGMLYGTEATTFEYLLPFSYSTVWTSAEQFSITF